MSSSLLGRTNDIAQSSYEQRTEVYLQSLRARRGVVHIKPGCACIFRLTQGQNRNGTELVAQTEKGLYELPNSVMQTELRNSLSFPVQITAEPAPCTETKR